MLVYFAFSRKIERQIQEKNYRIFLSNVLRNSKEAFSLFPKELNKVISNFNLIVFCLIEALHQIRSHYKALNCFRVE